MELQTSIFRRKNSGTFEVKNSPNPDDRTIVPALYPPPRPPFVPPPSHPITLHDNSIPPHRPRRLLAAAAPCHRYESRRFQLVKCVEPTVFGTSSATARLSSTSSVAAVTVSDRPRQCSSNRVYGCRAPTRRITSPPSIMNSARGRIRR